MSSELMSSGASSSHGASSRGRLLSGEAPLRRVRARPKVKQGVAGTSIAALDTAGLLGKVRAPPTDVTTHPDTVTSGERAPGNRYFWRAGHFRAAFVDVQRSLSWPLTANAGRAVNEAFGGPPLVLALVSAAAGGFSSESAGFFPSKSGEVNPGDGRWTLGESAPGPVERADWSSAATARADWSSTPAAGR